MKKTLLITVLFLTNGIMSYCQTNATNFTANDCNANSHTLFTELDQGDVIVLAWIMPCISCTAPVKTAYNIAKTYNNKPEYAGRVKFYLIDDYGDQNCTYLSSWASNNNIGPDILTVFDNAPGGNVIKENDYGGTGMPHICIVGGNDHKIYFNKFNGESNDATGIEYALFSALIPTSISNTTNNTHRAVLYPNPANTGLNIEYDLYNSAIVTYNIFNVVGKKVHTTTRTAKQGKNTDLINTDNLQNGVYFIQINAGNNTETLKFSIVK